MTDVRIPVVSPDGERGSVPIAELAAAKDDGFQEVSLADAIDAAHGEVDRRMASATVTAASVLAGAGRSATFGMSDLAASGLGLGETANEMREAHPTASFVGELAGMTLAPGVGAAGRGAASLAARVAGSGARTALGKVGQGAVRYAAQGAAEMALLGAGEGVSEEALGDPDTNAEKLFASAIRHGIRNAGWGAAGGAILGGVLGGVKAARGAYRAAADEGMSLAKATEQAENAAAKPSGGLRGAYEEGGLAGAAEHEANVYAAKAAGIKPADLRKMVQRGEDVEGAIQRVGKNVRESGIGPFTSQAEIAERAGALRKEAIDGLDASVTKLDKAVHRFDVPAFTSKVETEVVAPLMRDPSTIDTGEAVQRWLANTKKAWGEAAPTYREAWKARQALDDLGQKAGAARDNPLVRSYRDVRRTMEAQFEADAEKAGSELGEDVLREYRLNKAKYGDWNTIEQISQRATNDALGRGPVSLGDRLSGLTGALMSPVGSGVVGHFLGGGIPGALLGAAFNKALRTYGNQIASTAFDRASKLGVLSRGVAAADKTMAEGIARVTAGPVTATGAAPRIARDRIAAVAEEVQTLAADHGQLSRRIQGAIGRVHESAPSTAAALAFTASRAISHLAEHAPKGRTNSPSLTPFAEKTRHSDRELDQFAARLEAVEDPMSVLDDVARGRLPREKIETLKIVYPKLYAELRQKVALAVAARTKPLPWESQKAYALLLGVPTSPVLEPGFVRAMQATKQPTQAAQPDAPRPRQALSQVKTDPKTYQTPSERIAAR